MRSKMEVTLFERLVKPLSGKGIGLLPGIGPIFFFLYKKFGPKGIGLVEVGKLEIYVDKGDIGVASLVLNNYWDPLMSKTFREVVKEGMTVLDLGAYVGYYTLLAARLVGHAGKVISFEPTPKTFDLLKANVERYGFKNVTLVNKAVSDSNGTVRLYTPTSFATSNTFSTDYHTSHFLEVPTVSLDNFLGDTKVDIIKMDVEGAEILALRGMKRLIERSPNLRLFTEVSSRLPKGIGSSLEEYIEELSNYFNLFIIMERDGRLVPYESTEQVRRALTPGRFNGCTNLYGERK